MARSVSNPKRSRLRRPSRHTVLVGLSTLAVAVALSVGLFVQLAGYRLIAIDRRDATYSSVIARQIARDTPTPPFIAQYPVTLKAPVDDAIQQYVNNTINTYMHERSNRSDATEDEQLQIGYTLKWYDDRTVTVDFTRQKHQTNRIWDKHTETLTFNPADGKVITPSDIITNVFGLASILYDYRRANNATQWSSAELISLLELDQKNIIEAIPYGNAISFTFKVGKRVETVAVKKALLTNIIAPAYQHITVDKNISEPPFAQLINTLPSRDDPITPTSRKLALMFDDGPGADTPRLLDALYRYRAHATFFVIGKSVAPNASTLKREVAEGHEISNHTWGHPDLRKLSEADIARQIQDTQIAVQQATGGYSPRIVRPPYGSIDARVSAHLQALAPTLWSVDTLDWLDRDPNVIYQRIMAGARQNAVILLHDIHPQSVDAAIRAIRQLRADGWQLVTISQL